MDQMLKYGSCATNGTAGGRNVWARVNVQDRAVTARIYPNRLLRRLEQNLIFVMWRNHALSTVICRVILNKILLDIQFLIEHEIA